MKVTVERAALLRSLGHVHRVVERRNTIPILSNVLLRGRRRRPAAQGDRPRHRGHRDDRGRCRAGRRDDGAGATSSTTSSASFRTARRSRSRRPAIPARCRSAPAARASCCRPCPRATSPISPRASCRIASRCRPADLKRLIDKTQFAISTEETRYYLNGIFFHTIEAPGSGDDAARRRDRRPPARPRRDRGAGRRRRHAGRDRAAQGRRRDPEAPRGRRGAASASSSPPPRSA